MEARVMVVEATRALLLPVPVRIVLAEAVVSPVPPAPTAMVEEPVMLFAPVPKAKPVKVVTPVPPLNTESAEVAVTAPLVAKRVPPSAPTLRLVILALVAKRSVEVPAVVVASPIARNCAVEEPLIIEEVIKTYIVR